MTRGTIQKAHRIAIILAGAFFVTTWLFNIPDPRSYFQQPTTPRIAGGDTEQTAMVPANDNTCDVAAADVARVTGATLDHRATYKIFLRAPGLKELSVECWPAPGIDIALGQGLPSDGFFALVGQIGALATGLSAGVLKQTAIACHREALKQGSKDIVTEIDRGGAHFACGAALTPAPGATTIMLSKAR